MAVPTGDCEVQVCVDLTPAFDRVQTRECIRIVQPGPDALDKAIARIGTAEGEDLWEAVDRLQWFTEDGERVVPVLLEIVGTEDHVGRYAAIYALSEFPAHKEESRLALVPLLEDGNSLGCAAAMILACLYPKAGPLAETYREAYDRAQFGLVRKAGRAIRRLVSR